MVVGLIVLLVLVVVMAGVMWLAVGSTPTRPQPDSRYRGVQRERYLRVVRRRLNAHRVPAREAVLLAVVLLWKLGVWQAKSRLRRPALLP